MKLSLIQKLKAVLHYARFRATCLATAKSSELQFHNKGCYTLQCFLQLSQTVSQLSQETHRRPLEVYFQWLITRNIVKQVARGVLHCAMLSKESVAALPQSLRLYVLLPATIPATKVLRDLMLAGYELHHATCVATKLRDKLHEKVHGVTTA